MTIISSGALALQDLGTNTSSNVDNVRLSTSFTAGVDGLLQLKQLNEVGDGQFSVVTVWQGDAYGFVSNMFSSSYIHTAFQLYNGPGFGNWGYSSQSNIGSLGTTGYLSADGTSRSIGGVFWGLPDASPNNVRLFVFALNGTGITNTDTAAWSKIEVTTSGGTTVTINRSDLSYDSSENGDSWWYWKGSSGTMYTNVGNLGTPSSSSYTLKVIGGTTTATLNNGIAEEFGGNDSSNVKMSDYYKGAASGYVNTGAGTSGIPTSGAIAFSDFYGASYVANTLTAVEVQHAAKYQFVSGPRGGNYEHFTHGFGHSYLETVQTSYATISTSIMNDSAQGSIIGSPNMSTFGIGSSFGTLRAILHGTAGPSGASAWVILIVGQTGSNSNAGFTNFVASRSGMTSLTLTRAAADNYNYYTADGGTRLWRWIEPQYGSTSSLSAYDSGSGSSGTRESLIFSGGAGSGSANTTTTSRTTWTIS